jgi:hypothetical protein
MQRRVLIGALLLAGGAPPAFAQAVEWQEIAGEEGRFRLQMPKGFREVSGPRPDGSMARQYQFTTSEGFGLDFAIVDFVKAEPGHPPTCGCATANARCSSAGRARRCSSSAT